MAKKKSSTAQNPAGHHHCRGDQSRPYRLARWLGPIYTVYRIVRDHWDHS
ncbi:hypothetical protein [Streptomyces sp. NPDC127108]